MAKEKIELFEEIVFDDVQYAVDMYNAYKKKLAKVKKGIIYAVFASVINLTWAVPVLQGYEDTPIRFVCLFLGIILTVIAYVKGGGIISVFRWAWRVGRFAWGLLFFPFDIFLGICVWYFSLLGFLFLPIIVVLVNYGQIKMNFESAEQYISYFKARPAESRVYKDEYDDEYEDDMHYGYDQTRLNYGQRSNSYRQSRADYGRMSSGHGRVGTSYERTSSNYGRTGSGYERTGNGYGRPSSSYERTGSGYGRTSSSYDRPSSNYGRAGASYDRPSSNYGRTNSTYGQTRTGTSYRQSGSSYNRTGGYSSTRNYR